MRAVLPAVGWWFSRLLGPLFTCQVVAHFPKEDFSVFILKTLVFCEQRGSFCVDGSGRSDEDISRRCHPRCPVGRAPVGEGVEGGVAVGGGDGEGRGGGGTLVSRRREREACYSKEWTCVTSPAILRAPE